MVITQTLKVPANRRLEIDVPPEFMGGSVVVAFMPEIKAQSYRTSMRGCLKGKVWMADDFCAPLEDMAEYM